jgi:hypothetical protein
VFRESAHILSAACYDAPPLVGIVRRDTPASSVGENGMSIDASGLRYDGLAGTPELPMSLVATGVETRA